MVGATVGTSGPAARTVALVAAMAVGGMLGAVASAQAQSEAQAESSAATSAKATTLTVPRPDGRRVRVSWPTAQKQLSVAAGSKLRVVLSQPKTRTLRLSVSLVRNGASGRAVKLIQRKRLTRGTVTVTVPEGAGRKYTLRIARGPKYLRRTAITVPASSTGPSAPAPTAPGTTAPTPTVPAVVPCNAGRPNGEITFAAPTVVRGERLGFSVLNTGSTCFDLTGATTLERRNIEEGEWEPVTALPATPSSSDSIVRPGGRYESTAGVQPDAAPGSYRLTIVLKSAPAPGQAGPFTPETTRIANVFEVLAP